MRKDKARVIGWMNAYMECLMDARPVYLFPVYQRQLALFPKM